MSSLRLAAIVALAVTFNCPVLTMAAEKVGEAVLIKTAVTGASGPLVVKAPVHRDERIRTSNSGLGQFVFRDGTKLAVGWGSSVVIDQYVFDNSNSVKKLTIRAAKGTFRWISGNSSSSAYRILTPAGTIGVRGTAFDFTIRPDGTTAIVLLRGSARMCSGGSCKELRRRCDCVVATPRGGITDPSRVNRSVLARLGTSRALPFLSGNQQLSGGFGAGGANCGLTTAAALQKGETRAKQPAPQRSTPAPERPSPGKAAPERPSPGKAAPERPSPGKASAPSSPSNPSRPDPPSRSPSARPDPPSPPAPGKSDDGNNGHGNDPGKHDASNPGKSLGPGKGQGRGHGKGNGNNKK